MNVYRIYTHRKLNTAFISLGTVLLIFMLVTPYAASGSPAAPKISAAAAKAVLDSGEPYLLLDVRTQEEYDGGSIPGAILLPYDEIRARAATDLPADKDALIIVYCRSGRRSAIAAGELLSLGYTNVHDLGGINSWPYETVSTPEKTAAPEGSKP